MKLPIFVHNFFDLWCAPAWFSERLRSEFPGLSVVHPPDHKRIDEEIIDTEIALAWSLRPQQIAAARKLRWIHSPAAAVNQLMFPELVNSDIVLTNARGVGFASPALLHQSAQRRGRLPPLTERRRYGQIRQT